VGGAVAAWLGFTLPSALLMVAFAMGLHVRTEHTAWLHGLQLAAIAVVAQAVSSMGRQFCRDARTGLIAALAAIACVEFPTSATQLIIFAVAAVAGWRWPRPEPADASAHAPARPRLSRRAGVLAWACFGVLAAGLPLAAALTSSQAVSVADRFFRVGSLVFGGGHVVLPLLREQVVPAGWISDRDFLAGYGAAQALPGPLFSFAAYLGAAMTVRPNGLAGAALCLAAIYLPSFLMLFGLLPFWESLRESGAARAALGGINAAVVGILLAALYTPMAISTLHTPEDPFIALSAVALLLTRRVPSIAVIAICVALASLTAAQL
jgi:chromate transporter